MPALSLALATAQPCGVVLLTVASEWPIRPLRTMQEMLKEYLVPTPRQQWTAALRKLKFGVFTNDFRVSEGE